MPGFGSGMDPVFAPPSPVESMNMMNSFGGFSPVSGFGGFGQTNRSMTAIPDIGSPRQAMAARRNELASTRGTFGSERSPTTPVGAAQPGSSASEERDQQRRAQDQKSPAAVGVNIAAGVRDGSLTPNQFASGLSPGDAASACGPAAAVAFARAYGRFPTLAETVELAKKFGWTQRGTAGPVNQVNLLNEMGIKATLTNGVDWRMVASQLSQGRPVILDTPEHYYVIEAYDPDTGKFDFGNSSLVLNKSGGRRWLSAEEMMQINGGQAPRSMITLNV